MPRRRTSRFGPRKPSRPASSRYRGQRRARPPAPAATGRVEGQVPRNAAAKPARVNLSRSLASSWAKGNVVVSCVAHGFTETEEAKPEMVKHYGEVVNQIPLRRVGSFGDVAGVILFLASPMGDYLNGVTIDINGGSWFQ